MPVSFLPSLGHRLWSWWRPSRKPGAGRDTLDALQKLTTQSAVGAAKTSVRLDSVSTQVRQASESLAEMLRAADRLQAHFVEVSSSVGQTLSAAQEMNQLTADGRNLSQETQATSSQLQAQMRETVERIERLMKSVSAITSVSETIEGIARKTMLLSFNAAIEAARAGQQGAGFAVVAAEVRSLAQHTETHTKAIKESLDEIKSELKPARQALLVSQGLVEKAAVGTQSVGASLERVAELADGTASNMEQVAAAISDQRSGIETVFSSLKTANASSVVITKDTEAIVSENYAVSQLVDESFQLFASAHSGTKFHRGIELARILAQEAGELLERAVDEGRCTLEDVLAYEYREIKGAEIQNLRRLFDVSRVPASGFTPAKYHTRYDQAVDLDIQALVDDVRSRDPMVLYGLVLDLNLYASSHHKASCQDWTGDAAKDLVNNRCKRFFYDKWLTTDGVRVGLGEISRTVPDRSPREAFVRAGCEMKETPEGRNAFNIKLFIRDNGVVFAAQVPIFVQGHRYGAASIGWMG